MIPLVLLKLAAAVSAWEHVWWGRRRMKRRALYDEALACARRLGRPLVVVGAPDMGPTEGPGCGDVTVDIGQSACPTFLRADVCERLPFDDDSVVVFVSCVLEYVADYDAAKRELRRVSGGRLYVCRVEWWTLTAHFYPGAKRVLPASIERPKIRSVASS